MRPTIKDIADRAGVSKTTVSFALNNPGRISAETRDKILAIVREMGYFPNPVARTLTTKRIGSLGLLLPQPLSEVMGNPHICEVIGGLGEECDRREISLTMLPPVRGKLIEAAKRSFVDAIVTIGVGPGHEVVEFFNRHNIPFVTIDGEETESTVNVGIDNEKAACDLMRHILGLGHRRIAIMCVRPDTLTPAERRNSTVVEDRLAGFSKSLAEAGLTLCGGDVRIAETEGSLEGGRIAALELFDSHRPTAIVAMADIIALGVYAAADRRGLAIPSELSVAGFDDIALSRYSLPPLTTIRQPGREKGRRAASMAIALLDGQNPGHCCFPYTLEIRGSTAVPRREAHEEPAGCA